MAGLGFKDFAVGEVLTSADVDGYLMQQTVMRFADAGARGSALGTAPGTAVVLAEGMVSYLDDVNRVEIYNGTSWIPSGRISQVVQTVKTDAFSSSSTAYQPVTGVSVAITPTLATSKILVSVNGQVSNSGSTEATLIRLRRDSTDIALSSGGSSDSTTTSFAENGSLDILYLDSPATTSSVTYSLTLAVTGGTGYVGRIGVSDRRGVTTITAIEVTE